MGGTGIGGCGMTTETRKDMVKEVNSAELEQLLETAQEIGQVFEAFGKCNARFEIRPHTSMDNINFYKNLDDGVIFRQQPSNTFVVVRYNTALVYIARP